MQRVTMTTQETADYLGVCIETIYKMVQLNEIPHFRVRRRIFFSQDAVNNWIKDQESNYEHQAM
ncbi:helix-turn-helix domain-containing protein [Halobacillus sp. Marseille-Q1614]|uniref:helix-turn-helix domain-containing protein n=1 Tax=Halobacillus sp. Marseille-Q1614 TaxID=2709134 RepID=UPI001570B900|nr:helix-turn-helix domain-containing protein [Halobacillus sp. Marseille-Q1614]